MKIIQAKDVLSKSIKELITKRNELKKELFDYTLKNSMRALKQTHLIRVAKRNIARINTALASKRVA